MLKRFVDGDQLNGELLLDEVEHDNFYKLAPHFYVMDFQRPKQISGYMKLPQPVAQTISWFTHEFD